MQRITTNAKYKQLTLRVKSSVTILEIYDKIASEMAKLFVH